MGFQAGWGLGWAGLGGRAGLGGLAGWGMKRKLVYSKTETCVSTEKNKLPGGKQQQATSIYLILESLGFRV